MTEPPHWARPPREHLELLYAEMKESLSLQLTEIDNLNNRVATLLTPIGVLLGLGINSIGSIGSHPVVQACFNAGLVVLFLGLLCGIMGLRLREVMVAPTATGLWPAYSTVRTEEMLATERSSIAYAYVQNAKVRLAKTPWITRQFLGLIIGALLLGLSYGIRTAGILG